MIDLKFPPHKCSLTLTHNQHKGYYESISDYIGRDDRIQWVSEEEKQKAVKTNEIWELQWYPDTPVGFYCAGASTLDALMEGVQDGAER